MMKNTTTLTDYNANHCYKSMEKTLLAVRYLLWKRTCPELKDTDFTRQGLLRCISAVDSGGIFYKQWKKFRMSVFLTRLILNHSSLSGVLASLKLSRNRATGFTVRLWHHKDSIILSHSRN